MPDMGTFVNALINQLYLIIAVAAAAAATAFASHVIVAHGQKMHDADALHSIRACEFLWDFHCITSIAKEQLRWSFESC